MIFSPLKENLQVYFKYKNYQTGLLSEYFKVDFLSELDIQYIQ